MSVPSPTPPRNLILGIETSNPSAAGARCGVALGALQESGLVRVLRTELLGSNAAAARQMGQGTRGGLDDDLMPAIDRLFRGASKTPRDLAIIATSVGPGGYTGLRVACAVAAMIGEASGCACVAVPSALAAVIATARGNSELENRARVGVLLASKGEGAWCEVYRRDSRAPGWVADEAILPRSQGLIRAENLSVLRAAGVETVLGDQFVPATVRAEAARLGMGVMEVAFDPSAVVLAGAASGERIEPSKLVPRYPREPDAVTLWRERHAR